MDAGGHMKLGKSQKPTKRHTNKRNQGKTQIPSQICILPYEKQRSKQPTGPEPNQKLQKIYQGHSGKCRIKEQKHAQTNSKRIMTPRSVKHATAWLPARQQIVAFARHCKLPSLSESTHKYLFTCPTSESK